MTSRIKEKSHLIEKLERKHTQEGKKITEKNVFSEITDIAGIRVLHLHQKQFSKIQKCIKEQIDTGDSAVTNAISHIPLPPPVDASKFEQVNEGPAPMADLADHTEAGAEDVVDASADIDF